MRTKQPATHCLPAGVKVVVRIDYDSNYCPARDIDLVSNARQQRVFASFGIDLEIDWETNLVA